MPYTGSYENMSSTSRETVAKRKRSEPTIISRDFKFPDGRSLQDAGYPPGDIVLDCWTLDENSCAHGDYISNKSGKIASERLQQFTTKEFGKPSLNRAQLSDTMTLQEFMDDELTVSHLCHKYNCVNPSHIYMAPLDVNKGMNGCAGGNFCTHEIRCIRPGPGLYKYR